MKLNFGVRTMDVGTPAFNLVRTLSVMGSGGAELSEWLLTAERIKDGDAESWVREWAATARSVQQAAEQAARSGQNVTASQAYLRASNYHRAAMFSLPPTDPRLDGYLTLSRECFHQAAGLLTPPIEILEIPFETARLPGYFLSAGPTPNPTLVVLNGGDSTNEEMAHWLGFAAVARGWNCLVFEGPGQWSALQLNPGLHLRPDYEAPLRAVLDHALARDDVDPDRIALFGPSLGATLAARAVAFEDRIRACVCDGLTVDVHEAWHAVWPLPLRKAPPRVFDAAFGAFERLSPSLRGAANRFRAMFGLRRPHELMDAWRPFQVRDLASRIKVPMLLLYGEGELAQSNDAVAASAMRFVAGLSCPVTLRVFGFDQGWAASHCQVGAMAPMRAMVFDWLDQAVRRPADLPRLDADLTLIRKHVTSAAGRQAVDRLARAAADAG